MPSPDQISFTPDGTTLVVTEKSTRKIDTYAVSGDGTTTGPLVQGSAGQGPFGFSFEGASHLVVSEINNSSASSYTISAGVLQVVTAHLADFGRAACSAICTTDPGLPQQYAYVSNTNSDNALREKRAALIHAYAKEKGWSATVTYPGMRATFRKLS